MPALKIKAVLLVRLRLENKAFPFFQDVTHTHARTLAHTHKESNLADSYCFTLEVGIESCAFERWEHHISVIAEAFPTSRRPWTSFLNCGCSWRAERLPVRQRLNRLPVHRLIFYFISFFFLFFFENLLWRKSPEWRRVLRIKGTQGRVEKPTFRELSYH